MPIAFLLFLQISRNLCVPSFVIFSSTWMGKYALSAVLSEEPSLTDISLASGLPLSASLLLLVDICCKHNISFHFINKISEL